MVDKMVWFLSYCDFLSQKSYNNKLSFYLVHICKKKKKFTSVPRILIVMLTITYNKILANLNNMWKYARLYLIIQVKKLIVNKQYIGSWILIRGRIN